MSDPTDTGRPLPPARLWKVRDVMAFLSVSERWVYLHVEKGDLPYRRIGGLLRFAQADIEAYSRGENVTGGSVVPLRRRRP